MKKLLILTLALLSFNLTYSQQYSFRKPTVSSGVYKFSNVLGSVDAYVSQVGSVNASINQIDDSTVYPLAWQPFIKFTNSTSNSSDSSYVEFLLEFKNGSNLDTQSLIQATVVDCDGTSSYREFVKSSTPVTGWSGYFSTVSYKKEKNWFSLISSTTTYSTIDTTNQDAMAELKYTNTQQFKLRVGVVGIVSANQVRQFSFYFKHFDSMLIALPLRNIKLVQKNEDEVEPTSIYYDQYGHQFEGTYKQFAAQATLGVLYFDTKGKKYIVIK
jgi:hypothetical protein